MYQFFLKYSIVTFLLSSLIIPLIIIISKKFNLFDYNDGRKIHTGNISRLGGLAIFSTFFGIYIFFLLTTDYRLCCSTTLYSAALIIAFLTGFIDDIVNIRARYKLLLQIIAAVVAVSSGLIINGIAVPGIIQLSFGPMSVPITIFWILLFMNAVNLMDGMDGLAGGVTIIAGIFMFVISIINGNMPVAILSAALVGSISGFFIFNCPPAKIFMGDGGAYFIGFVFATLPLMGISKTSVAALFIFPFILFLIHITDILNVMVLRKRQGNHIFTPDKNHIHHRLLGMGLSVKKVLLIIYSFSIVLGFFSLLLLNINKKYVLMVLTLIMLFIFICFHVLKTVEEKIAAGGKKKTDRNGELKETGVYSHEIIYK